MVAARARASVGQPEPRDDVVVAGVSWPKIGGRSGATFVEPPNIDSAIPPLAFSSW
jgi:hypothetical protein